MQFALKHVYDVFSNIRINRQGGLYVIVSLQTNGTTYLLKRKNYENNELIKKNKI